jgi:ribosome biogenesis GTPase / thiamine phosphate phosphatase
VIVAQVLGTALLLWDGRAFHEATVTKRIKTDASWAASLVAVGDRVEVEEGGQGMLRVVGVGPRTSFLARAARAARGGRDRVQVIAANADQAVIVSSAADPPFRPGLVDRFALLALRGGMTPLLCLNKVDLAGPEEARRLVGESCLPLDAVHVSAARGDGLDALRGALAGRTSVLVGHSGVGKSSLLGRLFPSESFATREVSGRTRKGRHTTASARLYPLPEGGHVIDTPGVRAVPLGTIHPTEVAELFPEIHGAAPCRFRPCTHLREPGCTVREGVASGAIPERVYARYARLLAEAEEDA